MMHHVLTAVPILIDDLSEHRHLLELAKEAIFEEKIKNNGTGMESNVRATYVTPYDSHIENAKFIPLMNLVEEFGAQMLDRVKKPYDLWNSKLKCYNSWGMEYIAGDWALPHCHYFTGFSAICYIDVDDTSSPIIFEKSLTIQPKPNMIILFPAMVYHEVPKTLGKRILTSYNLEHNIK
jgi:hypothetical protein